MKYHIKMMIQSWQIWNIVDIPYYMKYLKVQITCGLSRCLSFWLHATTHYYQYNRRRNTSWFFLPRRGKTTVQFSELQEILLTLVFGSCEICSRNKNSLVEGGGKAVAHNWKVWLTSTYGSLKIFFFYILIQIWWRRFFCSVTKPCIWMYENSEKKSVVLDSGDLCSGRRHIPQHRILALQAAA